MDNYYQKSGSKYNADAYSTPTRDRQRPTTPIYLLQQSNEEQYVKNLMTNLSSYLTTKEPNYDQLNNLLLPKDVNYYYTEKTKVTEMIDKCYLKQKQTFEELIDDFLKQVIVMAEAAKTEIFDMVENEKKAYYDFYDKFSYKVESFLEQSGYKIDASMQNYKNYVNNMGREFSDPLEFELSRIKLEKRRFEEIESIFNAVRKDYTQSTIPEEKKMLEAFFSESKLPDSKIDENIIKSNIKSLIDNIGVKIKGLHKEEVAPKMLNRNTRPGSSTLNNNLPSSMLNKLNNYVKDKQLKSNETSPLTNLNLVTPLRETNNSKEEEHRSRPGSIANYNLHGSGTATNKHVAFKLPDPEKEHDKTNSIAEKLKSSNINININNIPYNNSQFINLYNQQTQLRKGIKPGQDRDYYKTKKLDVNNNMSELRNKRPASSIVGTQPNALNTSTHHNSSFSRNNGKSIAPIISLGHTSLFTKFSVPCNSYKNNLMIDDYSNNITCFDVSTEGCELFYGTKTGDVIGCTVNTELSQVVDIRKTRFSSPIIFILEISNRLVVSLDAKIHNLMLLNTTNLEVMVDYKTCNERIKLVAFHTAEKFFAVNSENRLLLYDIKKSSPIKSFKVTEQNIVDTVMASNNLLFTAAENGEIKSFKVSFETNSMALEGKLDLQCKIKNIEVFHNNEKLLIVNVERKRKSEIVIINLINKKVMNTVIDPIQNQIESILTFTIVKRPPEILLLALGTNRISYCDIDKPKLDNEIVPKNGEPINLRANMSNGIKIAKLLSQEAMNSTFIVGLSKKGLNLIKIH